MEIPKSFRSKNVGENTERLLKKKKVDSSPSLNALVIAVKGPIHSDANTQSQIYAWKEGMKKPLKVKMREDGQVHFCFYNNRLYDSAGKELYDTLEDELIDTRGDRIFGLCVHDNNLIEADEKGRVYESFNGKSIVNRKIQLTSIYSHNGELLLSERHGCIYNHAEQKEIATRTNNIFALCSHRGILYDGSYRKIMDTYANSIMTMRKSWINTLCSYKDYDGRSFLLDGGDYQGLYNTFTNEEIFRFEGWITSIAAIPRPLADKLFYERYGTTYVEPLC